MGRATATRIPGDPGILMGGGAAPGYRGCDDGYGWREEEGPCKGPDDGSLVGGGPCKGPTATLEGTLRVPFGHPS